AGGATTEQPGAVTGHDDGQVGVRRGPHRRVEARPVGGVDVAPPHVDQLGVRLLTTQGVEHGRHVQAQLRARVLGQHVVGEAVAAHQRGRVVGVRAEDGDAAGARRERQDAVVVQQHDRLLRQPGGDRAVLRRVQVDRRRGACGGPVRGAGRGVVVEQPEVGLLLQHPQHGPVHDVFGQCARADPVGQRLQVRGAAAEQALVAGIDVELPTGTAYLEPLADRVRSGALPEHVVDRAVLRVLEQKAHLGLLDDDAAARAADRATARAAAPVDLDPPEHRAIAARLAEQSVVLLHDDGVLPLAPGTRRIAVLGPNADDPAALMGCYSFANHVLPQHPGTELGLDVPTVLDALRREQPDAELVHVRGCDVDTADRSGFDAAVRAAADSDLAVVVAGDRAGLFGRGTSGG
ncbi:glycoside hydrolase family 3 C-terminal domain-containing protein, partial [Pseudonocardia sp. ICBG1122]|nr:glycoside hydrolase family 3 C-terminal domain-containing protein [Pseudonocardia pini]